MTPDYNDNLYVFEPQNNGCSRAAAAIFSDAKLPEKLFLNR